LHFIRNKEFAALFSAARAAVSQLPQTPAPIHLTLWKKSNIEATTGSLLGNSVGEREGAKIMAAASAFRSP